MEGDLRLAMVGLVCAAVAGPVFGWAQATNPSAPKLTAEQRIEARAVLKELIETNTSHSVGSTGLVAEAMRRRFLAAGFPAADMVIDGPDVRHNNLVVRYRGKAGSALKPVLIIAHTDVVEAKREDWTTDPFQLVEKDGYFYGRGTQDIKEGDAIWVLALLRLKREGFVPDRDVILALTADEEGGNENGVDWLLKHRRPLIEAGFALNPDAGGVVSENAKPLYLGVEATEKLYADFKLSVTNPGGHSSVPPKENAIYRLSAALGRLGEYQFPVELNGVTRAYFEAMPGVAPAALTTAIEGVVKTPPDPAAVAKLSADPFFNSELRTTCVATILAAGHAPNALPQRAEANVNCRILPGHTPGEIRRELQKIVADPKVTVALVTDSGINAGENEVSVTPPPLNPEVFGTLRKVANEFWPGLKVIPEMETGASDSKITMDAGIPSYGFSGIAIDENDDRAHGQDERLRVESYYAGAEFTYVYLKELVGK
jgi:acetylornithine deacetylase/succinyl-diaminopimelate desuccinylase-like protein